MRRYLLIYLLLFLCACGNNDDNAASNANTEPTSRDPYLESGEMIHLANGSVKVGSNDKSFRANEKPAMKVLLNYDFYIGKHEITCGEYAAIAKKAELKTFGKCKNDSLDNCKKYGRLYTWSAAIDSVYWASKGKICGNTKESGTKCELPEVVQGICPQGWHVPSIQEWEDLVLWQSYFASMETFRNDNFIPTKEEHHDFWTSSESTKSITYSAYLEKYTSERNYNIEQNFKEPKDTTYSIRCVKDN